MSTQNFVSYGDAETLMSGVKSAIVSNSDDGIITKKTNTQPSLLGFKSFDFGFTHSNLSGLSIWTDGLDIYANNTGFKKKFNRKTKKFEDTTDYPTFNGAGLYVWTDGINYYYDASYHQIINPLTKTASNYTPQGLPRTLYSEYIWTDGIDIYYSYPSDSVDYKLIDKVNHVWESTGVSRSAKIYGNRVWSNGEEIYCSDGYSSQYVFNKSAKTWSTKSWSGTTQFSGLDVWSDGKNIYTSDGYDNYKLNGSTWTAVTFNITGVRGRFIWRDEENTYLLGNNAGYIFTEMSCRV